MATNDTSKTRRAEGDERASNQERMTFPMPIELALWIEKTARAANLPNATFIRQVLEARRTWFSSAPKMREILEQDLKATGLDFDSYIQNLLFERITALEAAKKHK